jgi:hypothetical protein
METIETNMPETAAPSLPKLPGIPLDAVGDYAKGLAERAAARAGYAVTGLVLTQKTRGAKCIVDGDAAAWLAADAAKSLLRWKEPKQEAAPEGFEEEATPDTAPPPVVIAAPAARPVLTAPPSARLLESTEEALGVLARELGCVWNETVPHNAGWFVPGKATAHASAMDAIKGLFASLSNGGTIYVPKAAVEPPRAPADLFGETPPAKPAPKMKTAPQVAEPPAQIGLF